MPGYARSVMPDLLGHLFAVPDLSVSVMPDLLGHLISCS